MGKANEDLRLEIFKRGLSYREIAAEMKICPEWLSRAMAKNLTPEMRRRISVAVDELTIRKRGGA